MKRWELAILIGLICSILTCNAAPFAQQCEEVRSQTVRLHILANSDSEQDQALKLQVRDALLQQVGVVFAAAANKEEALELAQQNLEQVAQVARDTLQANGCEAAVQVMLVQDMYFATRQYEDVVMPAGRYDAIRVLIGEGAGHNWWCVMFPPLCLPAAETRPSITDTDTQGVQAVEAKLLPAKPEYKVKFAVVEWYERIFHQTDEQGQVQRRAVNVG